MSERSWTLRLTLEGPSGERYQAAMGVDAFDVQDSLINLGPPSSFDIEYGGVAMDKVVDRMRRREIRHDILARECERLGRHLAQEMQDAEGWHEASRVEPAKRRLAGSEDLPQ